MPTVYRGPYEYSVDGHDDDYWPQHLPGKPAPPRKDQPATAVEQLV
jgi:cytochrome c oxidase subunit 1